jgi:hypothetical protein
MYLDVRLLAAGNIGAEDTYVLQLTPSEGKPVRMSVSQRTALVVQRETEGQSITFSDYRLVDKERVPFATTIRDSLGETNIRITQIRFNRMFPDAVFAPQKQKSAGDASTD